MKNSFDLSQLPREKLIALAELKSRGSDLSALLHTEPEFDWSPQEGPQTLAFDCDADVIGYGGAAGGGKTDILLGKALKKHRRSVIFRREAAQLRAIIDRSREIIGDLGRLNENIGLWRGLPAGKQLEFGGVANPNDFSKWRGRPHDFIGFDEGTEFTEMQVRVLMAWCRSAFPGQRCQVVIAFNPPATSDGEWVISFFAPWLDPHHPNPAMPGELRYFAMVDGKEVERPDGEPFEHDGEIIQPRSRTFIPARLEDNKYLTGTDYKSNLQALPEPLRSQLLYGDFEAGRKDDPWQVIPTEWVRAAQERFRNMGGQPPKRLKPNSDEEEPIPMTCLGVDVARGGSDKTVLAPRYANFFAPLKKYPGKETPDGPSVAALVAKELAKDTGVNVDVIGVGSAAYDVMQMQGIRANPVNVAERSRATDKSGRLSFVNLRAEIYWKFREALDPATGENIALPDDPELVADLTAPRWKLQSNGILIESKEDIKKRLDRSPDCGDAVVLAHYQSAAQDVFGWYQKQYEKMKGQG